MGKQLMIPPFENLQRGKGSDQDKVLRDAKIAFNIFLATMLGNIGDSSPKSQFC